MIAVMRHRLVLSLYATIGLATLAAAAYCLFGTLTIAVMTIVSLTGGLGRSPMPMDFAIPRLAIHAGGTVLAGVVAWWSIRTWFRRRRSGPAPEDTSVGKTAPGRLLAVCIFGFFACYSGYTLFYLFDSYTRDALLSAFGTTVPAQITSIEPRPDLHKDIVTVHYRFTTAASQPVVGTRNQWKSQITEMEKTRVIPVTYVASWPDLQKGALNFDWGGAMATLGQYIAVFCVGIWGAGKNLGFWRRRDKAPARA